MSRAANKRACLHRSESRPVARGKSAECTFGGSAWSWSPTRVSRRSPRPGSCGSACTALRCSSRPCPQRAPPDLQSPASLPPAHGTGSLELSFACNISCHLKVPKEGHLRICPLKPANSISRCASSSAVPLCSSHVMDARPGSLQGGVHGWCMMGLGGGSQSLGG